jgi:penicillin-insensitive murein endopeptidase
VQGAVKFPQQGPNWIVVHPERHRNFGHPDLIKYLRALADRARAQKLGKLHVGDLGQPCGGPTPSGHRSHQNGLDVDIWYLPPVQPVRPGTAPPAPSVADLRTKRVTSLWNKNAAALVRAAASDPAVDRIFVHPAVKRALCQGPRGPWLARVRPWYGHQDHLHVRLRCPADSPACTAAQLLPAGEGCDASLNWWFSEDAQASGDKRAKEKPGETAPPMPSACEQLLGGGPTAAK